MSAHVLVDADSAGRGGSGASITASETNNFDLIAVAHVLEAYAAGRVRPTRHNEAFSQNGVATPATRRVMLCLLGEDGEVLLHSYGRELGPYYASGVAHTLRDMASKTHFEQLILQSVVNAVTALQQAQAEAAAKQNGAPAAKGRTASGLYLGG